MSPQAFILLYGLPFLALFFARDRLHNVNGPSWLTRDSTLILAWLGLGLLIRLPLLWDGGFHYDIGTYKAWALKLSDPAAPLKIYEDGYFADYPPLYMYVLGAIGALVRFFGLESSGHFVALIKTPALLADTAVALLLLRATRGIPGEDRARIAPLFLASLYWLNPAIIFDSALWGQTESILALLLVASWMHWRVQRLWAASLLIGLAVAFKPQALFFAYVYGISVLVSQPLRSTLTQAALGLISFAVVVAPFALNQEPDWILKLYFSTAETYDYLTVNAYNLWALLGWNWARDPGSFLGLAAQTWAMLIAGGLMTAIGVRTGLAGRQSLSISQRGELYGWAWAMTAIAFFMFAPRMHERYILNIIPMLALVVSRREAQWMVLLWSIGVLANMGFVYHHYVTLDSIAPKDAGLLRFISAYNLVITVFSLMAWRAPQQLERLGTWLRTLYRTTPPLAQYTAARETFTPAHILPYLTLGAAALLIGSFALGSQNYPVSGSRFEQAEQVTLRFDAPVSPKRLMVFIGEGQGKAVLEQKFRDDWIKIGAEEELKTFYDLYQLKLKNAPPARVFRFNITQVSHPLRINEIALLDADDQPLVPQAVQASQRAALIDEPATWVPDQGYLSSTEFDEIYHARTAYEYLHRLDIYETTHPPLGKWLIAWGIEHFGMTPWGMRMAGVIATSLTVLALIWGAWLLTGSTRAMWLTGLLGLFEFSRFSVGRYATIDGFLILFLLLAALCLWRAFCQPQRHWLDGWTLSPSLLFAGLFLGAAIATKWSALYFGFGVFVFFAISLLATLRQAHPWQRGARMIGVAAVALGVIPLAVYYTSYIPFLRCLPHAPDWLSLEGARQVWKSQVDMYDYHAKLKSTHAFQSAFFTWPLILKPLWLYVSDAQAPLRSSITLMGNPLVWWGGLAGVIALFGRHLQWPSRDRIWLLGSITALYLPWAGIARASFIYHYYPVVPFLILLLGVTLSRYPADARWGRYLPWASVALAGTLFVVFFPAISGLHWPAWYFKYLHWLPGWWML